MIYSQYGELCSNRGQLQNKQLFLFGKTFYCTHSPPTCRWWLIKKPWSSKALPPNAPGPREAEGGTQQLIPTQENNTQGLGAEIIITTKYYRSVHNDTLHQPQNTNSLWGSINNTTHMVVEGELAVKLSRQGCRIWD